MLKTPTRFVSALVACAGLSAVLSPALAGGDPCPAWDRAVGNPGAVGGSVSNAIIHDGELFVGGGFSSFEAVAAGGVARYDLDTGAASNVGGMSIVDGFVSSFAVFNPGDGEKLYIGGAFNGIRIDGIEIPNSKSLVSWDGTSIATIPDSPYVETFDFIQCMTVWNGHLVTGGTAGGVAAAQKPGLFLWDGTDFDFYSEGWGGLVAPVILAVAEFQGDLYVAGRFETYDHDLDDPNNPLVESRNVMRFDGTNFHGMGGGLFRATSIVSQVLAMKAFDDGSGEKLYVGGRFDRIGSNMGTVSPTVARWTGTEWEAMPGFSQPGREIRDFEIIDGELYAVGTFDSVDAGGTVPLRKFAKWTGSGWEEVGDGFTPGVAGENPNAFAVGEGRAFIAGSFTSVGNGTGPNAGAVSNIVEWVYDCGECAGDTNGDDMVNFADLNTVLAQFGQSGPGLSGDVNGDEQVNFADLNTVLANFGVACR